MKSTVFATLAGLGLTNSFDRDDFYRNQAGSNLQLNSNSAYSLGGANSYSSNNMNSFSNSGSQAGFNQAGFSSGYAGMGFGGAQNLAASSIGSVNLGGQGLSSGTGLSNIGTGAVLVSPAIQGTEIKSGSVITNGNFPRADIGLLSQVSSSVINNNLIASGIINNARTISSQYGATRSIDSLFNKLPSSGDIDNMILSADAAALIQTIQAIGTSESIPCDQRISYLLEMLGRLKAAVAKKIFAGSQVKIIIDAANKQIGRLSGLIDANNAAIAKLDLNGLKKQLQDLLNVLQDTYIKYNTIQSEIPTIEAQINGSDQQITILNKNSDSLRNSIANDKIKLTTINTDINSVQNRIKELRDRQAALEASIAKGQSTIVKNDAAIADINAKIDAIQAQIRDFTNNADKFSSQAKDLQVKVSRLRTDISVNEAKKARLIKDNQDLGDRLALEKKKNVPQDLASIQDIISTLRNLVPKVEAEIDRHYYYCFGEGKVQVQNVGGVVVYIVRGQAFGNYLKNLYGQTVRIPQVSGDIMLNRVNIFDQKWSGAFGYPFNESAFGTSDLSFAGSFGCMNPNSLVQGSGTITAIGANYIETIDNSSKQKQRFKLGSCSRLESTRSIPSVGQNFYFSGVPDGSGFNLYTGSCFD